MSAPKLTGRQRSELSLLDNNPGIWAGCIPGKRDSDLEHYLAHGLVVWRGSDRGYAITPAGRAALSQKEQG